MSYKKGRFFPFPQSSQGFLRGALLKVLSKAKFTRSQFILPFITIFALTSLNLHQRTRAFALFQFVKKSKCMMSYVQRSLHTLMFNYYLKDYALIHWTSCDLLIHFGCIGTWILALPSTFQNYLRDDSDSEIIKLTTF